MMASHPPPRKGQEKSRHNGHRHTRKKGCRPSHDFCGGGNTRTLDYVIRREMNVTEGDAYNRVLVDRSKNQIRALGFFKNVDIDETPGSARTRSLSCS